MIALPVGIYYLINYHKKHTDKEDCEHCYEGLTS